VTFAGQEIPLFQVGSGVNYVIMGGDVSRFAATAGELRFTALPQYYGMLDNIQFSPLPIPEPGAWGLLAVGVGLLVWRLRRR
jgi:hypothetical protein